MQSNEIIDVVTDEDVKAARAATLRCDCPNASDPRTNCLVGIAEDILHFLQDSGMSPGQALGALAIGLVTLDKAANGEQGSAARMDELVRNAGLEFKGSDMFRPQEDVPQD